MMTDETDMMSGKPPDWRPIPDPTLLTTEALNREIDRLRSSFEAGRDAMHDLLTARIDSTVAIEDEKFRRVEQRFQLIEGQRVEQKNDTQNAVQAALTAQKEAVREQTIASERAVGKSEVAMMKQMEQISNTFAAAIESLRHSIDDNKDRIVLLESRVIALEQQKIGGKEVTGEQRQNMSVIFAGVGVLLTIIIIAATLYLGTRPK